MSDLIDREQAIKEIYRKVSEEESNAIPGEDLDVGVIVGLKMTVRIIKEQPSVEKKGKWIWVGDRYFCSECKNHAYGNTLEILCKQWRYCPVCGAKMEDQ